jgi:hypothetical protein
MRPGGSTGAHDRPNENSHPVPRMAVEAVPNQPFFAGAAAAFAK